MIDWDSLSEGQICEPAVTKEMSNEQLIESIKTRLKLYTVGDIFNVTTKKRKNNATS